MDKQEIHEDTGQHQPLDIPKTMLKVIAGASAIAIIYGVHLFISSDIDSDKSQPAIIFSSGIGGIIMATFLKVLIEIRDRIQELNN